MTRHQGVWSMIFIQQACRKNIPALIMDYSQHQPHKGGTLCLPAVLISMACAQFSTLFSVEHLFAPCKGIQDFLGFRIPSRGFRIPVTGFRIPCLWIPDSKRSDIPDSKTFKFDFCSSFNTSFVH